MIYIARLRASALSERPDRLPLLAADPVISARLLSTMSRQIFICMLAFVFAAAAGHFAVAEDVVQLFDGKTLKGWTTLDGRPVTGGWEVVDGMIHLNSKNGRSGAIITAKEYDNYRLTFDWRIASGGNNGLKYRVRNYSGRWLGCEYQLLDDNVHKQGGSPQHSTGALYDLYSASRQKRILPAGKFNTSEVVVDGDRIEHWLNGKLVLTVDVGSDDWRRRVSRSKFSDLHGFGEAGPSRIMLTDHGSEIWYRNIKLEPLP
jgi:hypothetical protein